MALKLKYLTNTFSTIATRDAIPPEDRFDGMKVNVLDDGSGNYKGFQLQGGIDNSNWVDLNIVLEDGVDTIAIVDGAVTTIKIENGAVTTEKIEVNAVDNTILAQMAQATLKGRAAGAGTGNPQDLTAAQVRSILNVEDGADVTDTANVDAAGATMNTDTNVKANGWVLDEDSMASNDDTKVPTQQSVRAFVEANVSSSKAYQGGYNAATNTPDLDSSPSASIKSGWQYDVTADGTFFTEDVEVGDVLTARVDSPTSLSDWVVTNTNLTPASIKASYESNADTNEFNDAEKAKLAGIEDLAEVNPDLVSKAEAEAGIAIIERIWSAERVKQAIEALTPTISRFTSNTPSYKLFSWGGAVDTEYAPSDSDELLTSFNFVNGSAVPLLVKIDINIIFAQQSDNDAKRSLFYMEENSIELDRKRIWLDDNNSIANITLSAFDIIQPATGSKTYQVRAGGAYNFRVVSSQASFQGIGID